MGKTDGVNLHVKLEKLRESRKWTKTYVADKIGKPLTTYLNWENGSRNPDYANLVKLSNLYDVSIDYLLNKTDEMLIFSEEDRNFLESIENPELKRWFIDLSKKSDKDLEKLKSMWHLINDESNN